MAYDIQAAEFEKLLSCLENIMLPYGRRGSDDPWDYWINDDNYGSPEISILFQRLAVYDESIIQPIQQALSVLTLPWTVYVGFDGDDVEAETPRFCVGLARVDGPWKKCDIAAAFGDSIRK